MLDTHRLKIFLKIAELKSFSRAANELYLTQPTVSQHIAALEQFVGLPLFDRADRDITLTKAGELLYTYARQIITLQEEAVQALDHFKGRKSGNLVIGASTIPGEYVLPPLLGDFKKLYPDIHITMRIADTAVIVQELLSRNLELGIVGGRIKDEHLQYAKCADDEQVLIVPRRHRWWGKKEVTLEELAREPLVMREKGSGSRMSMEINLREAGMNPGQLLVSAEMGSTAALKHAVRSGVGAAFISRRAVVDEVAHGLLRVITVAGHTFARVFYVVSDRKRALSPLGKAFRDYVLKLKA
ncbi:MAG: LysR family transcriptional regulator [Deltaproteobacteria bacterium]|nr:LysR family transcriptional regulator [Deltaproteobacteria bacterium]